MQSLLGFGADEFWKQNEEPACTHRQVAKLVEVSTSVVIEILSRINNYEVKK